MVKLIVKNLPSSKIPLKATYPMTPKGITIHETYNDASALNEISYMQSNNNQTSYTYAVDDLQVVQGLPLDRAGWHAGDGKNGYGNRNTWGLEICHSKSGGPKYEKAKSNAIKFVAKILFDKGWGIDKVKKHQDWSGKNCPHRTLSKTGGWKELLSAIEKELKRLKGDLSTPTPPVDNPDYDKLAKEVISGKWGNGEDRKKRLGIHYAEVQRRVEEILVKESKPSKSIDQLAREVIDGKHGSGDARKKSLGSQYDAVQKRVNQLLGSSKTGSKTISQLVQETLRGVHGSGRERMNSLGSNYAEVQREVNRLLR